MKKQFVQVLPAGIFLVICLYTAGEWGFARFLHYHSQRQILAPAHYTAVALPVDDGVPGGYDTAEFRKSDDGRYLVRVSTLGTAHHMARTTSDLALPFVFALVGLVVTLMVQKKKKAAPNPQPDGIRC